ncbi:hypothetical protein F5148DRAFT_1274645 [Russula earlei]|uniref:Uncharacterized protein n=1 Tax=Russula earlei TaxID=71964 RepID=A0ACC0UI18_9AGAM|nr:hypothetical protein F5148DRAFT_1274645 [Russula earlei]
MEYRGNRPIRVLFPEELNSYSLTGNGDFPRIAKEEIEDKSKGDAISQILVILQTGWFMVQCIARGVQGLPVTELELIMVAFATLNFVMYLLWWNKPLNVQRGPIDDGDVEATSLGGFWDALGNVSDLGAAINRAVANSLPWVIAVGQRETHTMRVGTSYLREWGSELHSAFGWVAILGITLTFGRIHCIGWSFNFPSSAEQTLWHIASLTITAAPILFPVFPSLHPVSPFLYMLSRLVLLVLPLLSLRSLPPAAYHVVHWTSFIPHI